MISWIDKVTTFGGLALALFIIRGDDLLDTNFYRAELIGFIANTGLISVFLDTINLSNFFKSGSSTFS